MLGPGGPSGHGFSGFLPLGLAPQLKEQDMQVVNQARYQRCGRAMEWVAEIASRAWSLSHFGLRLNRKRAGLAVNGSS